MEANSVGSIVYLAFLLLFNGLAFLLVATAYFQMYRAVAGHGGGAIAAPGASSADAVQHITLNTYLYQLYVGAHPVEDKHL